MMKAKQAERRKEFSLTRESEEENSFPDNMSLVGIHILTCLAGLVGIWGFSCLVSGLTNSGSIFKLGAGWIAAVFGF